MTARTWLPVLEMPARRAATLGVLAELEIDERERLALEHEARIARLDLETAAHHYVACDWTLDLHQVHDQAVRVTGQVMKAAYAKVRGAR